VMASRSGPRQFVHVSGAALGPIRRIETRLVIGGRTIGDVLTELDDRPAGDVDTTAAGDRISLWSADVVLPPRAAELPSDGLAIVEVRWTGPDGSGGPTLLLLPVGDGRRD